MVPLDLRVEVGAAIGEAGSVLNRPPESAARSAGLRPQFSGAIDFQNVTFTYANTKAPALDKVSFTVPAGTKAGLVGLARSLAVELAPHGIQVNAVAPGQVRTEMIASALDRFGEEAMARTIPAGRIGEPEEIARAVRFLVHEAPDFLTGDVMNVDGGYLCR